MFYLTMHSTHFVYSYMALDIIMVNDHSDSERGNPLPPHGLLFPISIKGSFICVIHIICNKKQIYIYLMGTSLWCVEP